MEKNKFKYKLKKIFSNKRVTSVILTALLVIYPLYALGAEQADVSPNITLLGQSNIVDTPDIGTSGIIEEKDAFLEKYNIEAPDRKIPLDSNFDLFYGIEITDKDGKIVENKLEVVDNDGFNAAVEGIYNITYQVRVDKLSTVFSRAVVVTHYRVDMNDLVIVKETGEEDWVSNEMTEGEREKLAEFDSYSTEYSSTEDEIIEAPSAFTVDGTYYVAPVNSSAFEDDSILDNLKQPEVAEKDADLTDIPVADSFDILSTDPKSGELEPLDLRYGIKVLNSNDENIASYLEIADDDGFSMEEEQSEQYDVDYEIVYEGKVLVQFNRNVNVLGGARAGSTIISEMVISQTVVDDDGNPTPINATWGVNGNLLVNVNGAKQYASPGSGTVLRFLDGPLKVVENVESNQTINRHVVGDNIHSFLGYYQTNIYKNRTGMAMFDFQTLSGTTVQRRGFAGADDNTLRSPILADGEEALRNVITDTSLVEEFDVFNQEQSADGLSMTRKYKYYPYSGLLNKDSGGQILNNKPLFELTVTVRLVPDELRLLREITITNLGEDYIDADGQKPVFEGHLLYLADTFFEGNDYGFGFRDEVADTVYVRGVEDGARTMRLTGHQPSEASFAGAWHINDPGISEFTARYQEVYGQPWFDEALVDNAIRTNIFPYKNSSGTPLMFLHTESPHYSLHARTAVEGELPKNLNSMAYPITKTLFATDIPGKTPTSKSFINGSIDMAYAMQWKLPPTAVGESYTFVVEESWLDAADIQIVAPNKVIVPSGQSKILRFSAENTHMFDYALPALGQDWDMTTDFSIVPEGIDDATDWQAVFDKIYRLENGNLVEIPFSGTTSTALTIKAGEKYYFDIKVTVDRKALGEQENSITLKADAVSVGGSASSSKGDTMVEADALAVITSVSAEEIAANKVVAKVKFNNSALINPEDPTVLYNTTVKIYDSNDSFITEVTGKIASNGTLTLTGLSLTEGDSYKLVATAMPEAKGEVETTFVLSTEEATLTYAKAPNYAVVTGMPSPLVYKANYTGGNATFTINGTAPSGVGLIFKGWKDTDTNQIYTTGSTFSMLLSDTRRAATLETTWDVDPNYKITVSFDVNGGIGTVADQVKFVGDKVVKPTETVTKMGYKLTGWTTIKDDVTTKWNFDTQLSGVPQTIKLYAYWEEDPASWELRIVDAPDFVFKTTKISLEAHTVPLTSAGTLKIKDTYPQNVNWSLTVSAGQFKTSGGSLLAKNALQYFDSVGNGQSIFYDPIAPEGGALTIWQPTKDGVQTDYQRIFTTNLEESFGVSLLPIGATAGEKYEASMVWTIVVAP